MVPTNLRPAQLAGDGELAVDVDITELVVDDLEVVGIDRDVDGADLAGVHGELAGDVQRLAVLVENRELLQSHLVGLESIRVLRPLYDTPPVGS